MSYQHTITKELTDIWHIGVSYYVNVKLELACILIVEMGQNRYRVLEASGIGSISKYLYRQKNDTDTEYFSILFPYFFDTLHPIFMMSCNEIQTEHNTLNLMSLC